MPDGRQFRDRPQANFQALAQQFRSIQDPAQQAAWLAYGGGAGHQGQTGMLQTLRAAGINPEQYFGPGGFASWAQNVSTPAGFQGRPPQRPDVAILGSPNPQPPVGAGIGTPGGQTPAGTQIPGTGPGTPPIPNSPPPVQPPTVATRLPNALPPMVYASPGGLPWLNRQLQQSQQSPALGALNGFLARNG